MAPLRTPFEGVTNIVRFNWPFFVFAGFACSGLLFLGFLLPNPWSWLSWIAASFAIFPIVVSLLASHFAYDRSDLYAMPWLERGSSPKEIVTINAGFDESSRFLRALYPEAELKLWDFYDPAQHTEPSIARARRRYAISSETVAIESHKLPAASSSVDLVVLFLSAHEIRAFSEQVRFFEEVARILTPDGKVVLTEHLRDLPNFFAYTIGFLHFHSRNRWQMGFRAAGLVVSEMQVTSGLIHTFILKKS